MNYRSLIFIFLVLVILSSEVNATEYYVSQTGDNTNDGLSIDSAWATPTYAAIQAVAGDIIYIMNGTWYDNEIVVSNSGASGDPIVFTSYNYSYPRLEGNSSNTDNSYSAINLNGNSYINISRIEICNYTHGIYNSNSVSGYSHIHIDNMYIHDVGSSVVTLNGFADNCSITDSIFTNSGHNMIGLYGTTPNKSTGLYTHNCVISGNLLNGTIGHSAIDLFGEEEDIDISNNTIIGGQIYYHTTNSAAKGPIERLNVSYNVLIGSNAYGFSGLVNNSCFIGNKIISPESGGVYFYVASYNTTSYCSFNNILNDNVISNSSAAFNLFAINTSFSNNTVDSYGVHSGNASVYNENSKSYVVTRGGDQGSIYVNYTNGKLSTNTRNLPVMFYPSGSTFTVGTLFTTVTAYDIYLIPSSGYLTSLSTASYSDDSYSLSVAASEDNLSTNIIAQMNKSNTEYIISINGKDVGITKSNTSGYVEYDVNLSKTSQVLSIESAVESDSTYIGQISSSNDDAYNSGSGYFSTSINVENVQSYADNSSGSYGCNGLRFQNVTIPVDSTIDFAYIKFYVDTTVYDNANMRIYGNAVDNANDYNMESEVINRVRTSNCTEWIEDSVSQGWVKSPDMTNVISELITRENWSSGNNISILMIANTDTQKSLRAYSYDKDPLFAPKLYIGYSTTPLIINSYSVMSGSNESVDSFHTFTLTTNKIANYINTTVDGLLMQSINNSSTTSYDAINIGYGTHVVNISAFKGEDVAYHEWEITLNESQDPNKTTIVV
ncbi:hypothetical protein [uncultured Methanolobus sp.]|uniref:hypothetical protein n=1 Tax=uncultured Methanolobus sp. TaxID=218300 RepID=UPI002AAB7951|nr:hypothetical protein [uncultured Methanolobus sp.]